jgi:hypothetical protein
VVADQPFKLMPKEAYVLLAEGFACRYIRFADSSHNGGSRLQGSEHSTLGKGTLAHGLAGERYGSILPCRPSMQPQSPHYPIIN